jgi:16S rRNA (cytosine967-C5)-methyltransferase
LSDPRREAFGILRRVEEAGAYASILLEARAKAVRDPRDVALLTELVLGVLRRRAILDHVLAAVASRPVASIDPPVVTALRIGAYSLLLLDRVPDFAAVDTAVELARGAGARAAAGFVNGVLRRIAREGSALLPAAPVEGDVGGLALFRSHPAWWTKRLVDRAGWETADAILAANNEPAPAVLAEAAEGLASRLAEEGVVTEPGSFLPAALRVVSGVPQTTRVFRDGGFWIQDEASQLVPRLFADPIGPRVGDLCAAPGGKTLALAARLPEGGFVVAADRSISRLGRVSRNVARVRARGVLPVALDLGAEDLALTGPLDDVLVDAPCTGTGTLRRHPEIRWRLRPDDVESLAGRQSRLLDRAATLVRPGGRLVYSVCSIEPEEGPGVVARFLKTHPEFAAGDPRDGLPPEAHGLVGSDLALSTAGASGGLDGFFAALLVRYSAAHGGTP